MGIFDSFCESSLSLRLINTNPIQLKNVLNQFKKNKEKHYWNREYCYKKSCTRETLNLSTNADSSANIKNIYMWEWFYFFIFLANEVPLMWQRSAKSHSHRPSPADSTITSDGGDSISYFFEEKNWCIFFGKIVSSQAIIRNASFDQKSPRHWKAGVFCLRLGWIGLGPWADSVKKYTLMQISRYISTIF